MAYQNILSASSMAQQNGFQSMGNENKLLMLTSDQSMLNQSPITKTCPDVHRADFPEDFVFGAATSAYQVEGAWNAGGKGLSNWDVFTQKNPGGIEDGKNGCIAINHYNLLKEDVNLMKKLGLQSYRFSIAWTRVLPGGKVCTGVSREGVQYYNDLINALLSEGIEPCATLFHWDVPYSLELEYKGFLDSRITEDFRDFAEVCFWEFGDRVKRWVTLNEPWSFTVMGYVMGLFPPNKGATAKQSETAKFLLSRPAHRSGAGLRRPTLEGDPATDPYVVAHNLIIAHALAVDSYRERFQAVQGGQIGMTNVAVWYEPFSETEADKEASARMMDFNLGWFIEPMVTGDYPETMKENVSTRLPVFTEEQKMLVKGSYDFLGINYYTSYYAVNIRLPPDEPPSFMTDRRADGPKHRNGMPIGPLAPGSSWLCVAPWGFYKLMMYLKETYGDNEIYITENGLSEPNDKSLNVKQVLMDDRRVAYHNDHLHNLKKAIEDGVRVKGYYIWSLFDNYEWAEGYTSRFGIFFVDFENGHFTRYPKNSAIWWMNFLGQKTKPPSTKKSRATGQDGEGSVKRLRSS